MSSNVRRLLAGLIAAAAIVSALAGCADAGTKKESGNESEAEKIRLLYVALTRAEKKVFVISLISRLPSI